MRRNRNLTLGVAAGAAAILAISTAASAVAAPIPTEHVTVGSQAPLTSQEAAALSQNANTPVIVFMHDQPTQVQRGTAAATTRSNDIASNQAPLMSELSQVHAKHVRSFKVANAFAATVSKGEEARLEANPNVAQVINDSVVKLVPTATATPAPRSTSAKSSASSAPQVACAANGQALLEPEALSVIHADSDTPGEQTARSLGFTGAGVKVAWIADGIDINNPDFIRPNGQHVFADYEDFSGDGKNAPTAGGEAFLDAGSIAAQGDVVHNLAGFSDNVAASPCNIRIEGVAPGASLYGFKIFGQQNDTTTSSILQAIDFAVNVDHVDVINESFGSNPFPDTNSADAVSLFDDMAVKAGVTVTVSSGDAGITNTQGSPSTDPNLIAAGASTTFRSYQQIDFNGAQTFAPGGGWLSDNISALSSSGVNQNGSTIDLVAPGDLSFEPCDANPNLFADCGNLVGQPSDVELTGGTSQSSPLTAGTSALVIQAYRQSHHGASPSPALVKQILVSTADDLSLSGDEQGAGLLDSLKAVELAESIHDSAGAPKATGETLMVSNPQLDATGAQRSVQRFTETVTNTGATAQTVHLSGRALGPNVHTSTTTVSLNDTTSQHFTNSSGTPENFDAVHFTVPANSDRLTADIAFTTPAGAGDVARLILVDPTGKLAAYSLPQGFANFGTVDVRVPTAGQWTADIFSATGAVGGFTGNVLFSESVQRGVNFGTVMPNVLRLAPGQSSTVDVTETTPAQAGDTSGSLVLNAGNGNQTSVPVVLRSLANGVAGTTFTGTLTGGNGRQSTTGQENFFQFDVPAGVRDITASVDLANDPTDSAVVYLTDPQGQVVSSSENRLTTDFNLDGGSLSQSAQTATDVYAANPSPGRWSLLVNFNGIVAGDELADPFTARVAFDRVQVAANGLPDNAHATLAAGQAVTVPVTVRNNGTAPEDFFVDARLNQTEGIHPTALENPMVPLPLPATSPFQEQPSWFVPSQTSAVAVIVNATQPVGFDFAPLQGDPDTASSVNGTTATGSVQGNPVTPGTWIATPAELGPTPDSGGPAGTATMDLVAQTRAFDPAVTSPASDLWLGTVGALNDMTLVTVQPGATATIPVTITPSGPSGSVVQGTLFVDQLAIDGSDVPLNIGLPNITANDVAALRYEYRIG